MASYAAACSREMNQTRSYVLARLKDAAFGYMDMNHGDLPSEADILACLERDISDETEPIFDWYVDNFLAHATANAEHWATGKRYYNTISVAAPPNARTKLYILPSTEAFAVTAFECFRTAWMELWALKKKYPRTKLVPKKQPKPVDGQGPPPYEVGENGNKVYLYDDKFKGKFKPFKLVVPIRRSCLKRI